MEELRERLAAIEEEMAAIRVRTVLAETAGGLMVLGDRYSELWLMRQEAEAKLKELENSEN